MLKPLVFQPLLRYSESISSFASCCVQVRFDQQNPKQPKQLTRRCKSTQKVFEETCLPLKETPEAWIVTNQFGTMFLWTSLKDI